MAAPAHAQLIEDSKAKLKSHKVKKDKGGTNAAKKKGASESTSTGGQGTSSPRYSAASGNRFRSVKVSQPRYSSGSNASRGTGEKVSSPNYSQRPSWRSFPTRSGGPGYSRSVNWKGTTVGGGGGTSRPVSWKGAAGGKVGRNSQPVNWKGTQVGSGGGGTSRPVSWKGAQGGNVGRYSQPVNWRGTPSLDNPKYSKPVSWKGAQGGNVGRNSQPVNWRGTPYGGSPRYSQTVNWRGTPSLGSPRYSQSVNWKGTPYGATPRYSQPISWKGAYIPGSPRYSSFKYRFGVSTLHRRNVAPINDTRIAGSLGPYKFFGPDKKEYKKSNEDIAEYGNYVKLKRPHYKNMHPSVNHLIAKDVPSKLLRKGLRQWSVFWIRLNDGKIDPPGADNFSKKPKFDKRERHIWEPERDDKPTTRQDSTSGAETDETEEN